MSDYAVMAAGVALLGLVFTESPFLMLVYFLAASRSIDISQFTTITGFMVISSIGAALYKRLKQ